MLRPPRGGVRLVFGITQPKIAGHQERKGKLTNCIILSPFVAKRLVALLGNVLRDHHSRYGVAKAECLPPAGPDRMAPTQLPFPAKREAAEKADQLFQLIQNLHVEFRHEERKKWAKCTSGIMEYGKALSPISTGALSKMSCVPPGSRESLAFARNRLASPSGQSCRTD
jgi:hypothetical protein